MKNTSKVFAFAAIAAIMLNVLLMIGCSDDSDNPSTFVQNNDDPSVQPDTEEPFVPAGAKEIKLYAEKWELENGNKGEQWTSEPLKFADYTRLGAKKGDMLNFKISGTSDQPLKYAGIQLFQKINGEFKDLGMDSSRSNLGTSFTDHTFKVIVNNDVDARYDVYVQVCNFLWSQDKTGKEYDEFERLPSNIIGDMSELMATISGFTMTVSKVSPEQLTAKERWNPYRDESSIATVDHFSIDGDDIVKITIGGTSEPQEENNWRAWTIAALYAYTTKANTIYTYEFKARTESGTRIMPFQYYNDWASDTYIGVDVDLTNEWQTFTITGQPTPKAGVRDINFQLANATGTVYIQMISITETP